MDYKRLYIIDYYNYVRIYTAMCVNLNFEFLSHTNYSAKCFSKEITFDAQNYQMKGIHICIILYR